MQKGWEEYLRSRGNGEAIENPGGFVVRAGFFRAIDELRREGRQADGVVLDAVIDSGGAAIASGPSTEETAIAYVQAEELRDAVGQLSAEEQRVLSLHYFEELSAEASAAALFCSERTYRRRLQRALRKLCRILDAPVPEPGSELAIEIGLAAWVGLRGADVALADGLPQAFLGLLERGREVAAWGLDRLRGPATRLGAGGDGEKLGALASGPIGKVAGGCAGAAAVCLLGGAISGIGGPGDLFSHGSPGPHITRRASVPAAHLARGPAPPTTVSPPTASPPQPTATPEEPSPAQRRRVAHRAEQRQLEEQFSATARIASESSAGSATASSAPTAESVTVAPSGGSSTSSQASEEAQAEQQFGAFK
jgi:RNA polymerase sigma factor (sigma-70 family)